MTDDERARLVVGVSKAVAQMERRRIRRLVAPHLDTFSGMLPFIPDGDRREFADAIAAIDRATKAPRKARKGK